MFNPDMKPDINQAPWTDLDDWDKFLQVIMILVGNLMVPEYFFACQILTWGNCDLSETALIYMSKTEAVLWFLAEAFVLPWLIPEALLFTSMFSMIYAFQGSLFWSRLFVAIILDDSGDDLD